MTTDLITEAERRRDAGLLLATAPPERLARMMRAELLFLDKLIATGEATADDCSDDRAATYVDKGRWVGSIMLRLCRDRLIAETGCVRSTRPSRHRGRTGLYRVTDPDACQARHAEITAWLARYGERADDLPLTPNEKDHANGTTKTV